MRRALVVCAGVLGVLLSGSAASADLFAVAKPETQTVAINGTAAEFDGSDSYDEDPRCEVAEWAWDFDGDGNDDYSESEYDPWGDGLRGPGELVASLDFEAGGLLVGVDAEEVAEVGDLKDPLQALM